MNLIELATRRPVAIAMMTIAVLLFGFVSLSRLEVTLLPDLSYPTLTVRTELPGAAPTEVETLLSKPIEEAVGIIKNVRQVRSVSQAGRSDVTLEFNWGTKMDYAVLDVREKLDALTLPKEAVRPIVLRFDPSQDPIVRVGLSFKHDDAKPHATDESALKRLRRVAEDQVQKPLEAVSGVAAVKISGGLQDEVQVQVDLQKMAQLNLSLEVIAARLGAENANISGGRVEEGAASYLVRTLNQFKSLDELRDTIVATKNERPIYVKDVAEVRSGFKEREAIIRIGAEEAVEIALYKEGDANTVETAAGVKRKIEALGKVLPGDLELKPLYDQSVFIKDATDDVLHSAIEGGLLAVLVIYLFLRNARVTAIIAVAIPASVIATFNLMYGAHLTLNIMSLGGIALAIGLIVDDAIVVLENISRKHEQGLPLMEAAVVGTREVAGAVVASTLTNVAVFFPMVFVQGIAGQLFADQALVVTGSLMFSLIVSLTLTPMLVSRKEGAPRPERGWLEGVREDLRKARSHLWQLPPRAARATSAGGKAAWQGVRATPNAVKQWPAATGDWGREVGQRRRASRFGGAELVWLLRPLGLALRGIARGAVAALRFVFTLIALLILIPLVVGFRVIAFLLGLFLTPAARVWQRGYAVVERRYVGVLGAALERPALVLLTALAMFAASVALLPQIGVELIPPFNQGEFKAEVQLPPGTPLVRTDEALKDVQAAAGGDPAVAAVSSVAGTGNRLDTSADSGGENRGTIDVALKPGGVKSEGELMDKLAVKLNALPGASYKFTRPTLFTLKTPLEVEINGYDLDGIARVSELLRQKLLASPRFTEVQSTQLPGHPEIQIVFDQERAAALGLNTADLANRVSRSVLGNVATRYRQEEREIDVLVRGEQRDRASVESVRDLVINPESPQPVRLSSVADVRLRSGPSEIRRADGARVVTVSAALKYGNLGEGVAELKDILRGVALPQGVQVSIAGQSEEMQVSFRSLQFALALAVFLIYLVMASQFESLVHPFVILFTIPLAAIGAILALYLTGSVINVVALIGMIVLAGIVVKNGIVLIDLVNRLRDEGRSRRDAILEGGRARLRPILMTSMTAILGLVPMAIGAGGGAEVRQPMAITVIGGLLVSTLLTLVVIPVVYTLLDRRSPLAAPDIVLPADIEPVG